MSGPEGAKETSPVLSEAMHRVRVKKRSHPEGGAGVRRAAAHYHLRSPASLQDAIHSHPFPRQRVAQPGAVLLVPFGDAELALSPSAAFQGIHSRLFAFIRGQKIFI